MDRILSTFRRNQEPSLPLAFLNEDSYWEATIVRSGIVNAIGTLRATETQCREDYRRGRQNSRQAAIRTQVHRNQVQRLAQLGNRHAQLCYHFEHADLLTANINHFEDPTCRRALRGCFEEINALGLDSSLIQSQVQHVQVVPIILKWYSPAFTCTLDEFHSRVWYQSVQDDATFTDASSTWRS